MSQTHLDAFDLVKLEHEAVVNLLRGSASENSRRVTDLKPPETGTPPEKSVLLETVVVTAGDAYVLLLIAKAADVTRDYLAALGVPLPDEPRLGMLTDRCRTEFNLREPRNKIHVDSAFALHDVRRLWNTYA